METLGLESFKFFADYKMALFFIFYVFRRCVAIDKRTEMYSWFITFPKYDSFVGIFNYYNVNFSNFRNHLFLLFLFQTFGIKQVMLISMLRGYCVLDCLFMEINRWFMDHYVCVFMEWHLISLISQDLCLLKPIQNQKNRSSAQGLSDDDKWFWAVLGSFTQDGLLINILQSHLVARMIYYFLETETTNPKMLEFIKTKGV
jgi:NHS family xanthosine MFS transporter